jgi:hypothetical protein
VAGKRTQLQTKEGLKVALSEWHMLTVKMKGDHMECFLDSKKEQDVKDATFKDAGKVGLWSKADAVTHFDDFRVSENQ